MANNMDNNTVFKKLILLTGLSFNKELMIQIFRLGGQDVSRSQIHGWRISDTNNHRYVKMYDDKLDAFLNGLFQYRDLKDAEGIDVFNFDNNKTFDSE